MHVFVGATYVTRIIISNLLIEFYVVWASFSLSVLRTLKEQLLFCVQMCCLVTTEQYLRTVKQQVERPTRWRFAVKIVNDKQSINR